MKTLKLLQEPRRGKIPPRTSEDRSVSLDDDLIDLFPLPCYFQVHFQHLHEYTQILNSDVVQLRRDVAQMDEKLERLLTLLSRSSELLP